MKADNEDLHMANRSTTTSGRAPRIGGAAACLYCLLVISVLVLLEHCWPGPTHLYEEDPRTPDIAPLVSRIFRAFLRIRPH